MVNINLALCVLYIYSSGKKIRHHSKISGKIYTVSYTVCVCVCMRACVCIYAIALFDEQTNNYKKLFFFFTFQWIGWFKAIWMIHSQIREI